MWQTILTFFFLSTTNTGPFTPLNTTLRVVLSSANITTWSLVSTSTSQHTRNEASGIDAEQQMPVKPLSDSLYK